VISTPSGSSTVRLRDPFEHFKPKDESDYEATVVGRTTVKSRRHERLVREYAEWARDRGFDPSTPHPRDLVLSRGGRQWLIESEGVQRGNAMSATREALGQLYWYRDAHTDWLQPPRLVALFSEPVGDAFAMFLERNQILSVWHDEGRWRGSESAVIDGLAEE
jgi:hypothetical protein